MGLRELAEPTLFLLLLFLPLLLLFLLRLLLAFFLQKRSRRSSLSACIMRRHMFQKRAHNVYPYISATT